MCIRDSSYCPGLTSTGENKYSLSDYSTLTKKRLHSSPALILKSLHILSSQWSKATFSANVLTRIFLILGLTSLQFSSQLIVLHTEEERWQRQLVTTGAVSYTHLDVYKRQM